MVRAGDLPEPGEQSDYYILPRNHMSALVYIGFEAWLVGGKPGGRPRQRHSHRAFNPREFEGYRDRWELLDRHASDAPWLLPQWVWSAAEGGIGLPEGHPGLGRPMTAG